METKIEGGKLYIDGKRIDLVDDGSVLIGKDEKILCSAGVLYVNDECVYQFTMEQFNELKGGAS